MIFYKHLCLFHRTHVNIWPSHEHIFSSILRAAGHEKNSTEEQVSTAFCKKQLLLHIWEATESTCGRQRNLGMKPHIRLSTWTTQLNTCPNNWCFKIAVRCHFRILLPFPCTSSCHFITHYKQLDYRYSFTHRYQNYLVEVKKAPWLALKQTVITNHINIFESWLNTQNALYTWNRCSTESVYFFLKVVLKMCLYQQKYKVFCFVTISWKAETNLLLPE